MIEEYLTQGYSINKKEEVKSMEVKIYNNIDTIYHKRGGSIFFSLVLATAFAMAVFTACNPIWNYSGVDGACFVVMGRGILAGKVPYVDLIDNKGMVLYFLNAFPQLFAIKTQGAFSTIYIWGLEVAFLFASLRIIAWISCKLGVKHDYIPQIFYLLSIVTLVESGNLGEEYSNLFILIAFAIALQYVFDRKLQISWKYGMVLGIVFCLAFFIRPNNALPIMAIIITFVVGLIMQKDIIGLAKCTVTFLAGASIVCAPIFIYLYLNHAVMSCIQDTVLVNLHYAEDSGQTIMQLLKSQFGFKLMSFCFIVAVGVFTGFRNAKYSLRMRIYLVAIGISTAFAAYSALISRFAYSHYLLSLTPPTAVAIVILCALTQNRRFVIEDTSLEGDHAEQTKIFFSVETIWIILSISVILSFSGTVIKNCLGNLSSFEGNMKSYMIGTGTRHSSMLELAKNIPEDEKSSVYVLDGGTTNASDLYVQMGILPCKKLFVAVDRFARLIPGMEEEYKLYLKKDAPKWIITASELNAESYPIEFDEINKSYTFITSNEYGVYLYQRKN